MGKQIWFHFLYEVSCLLCLFCYKYERHRQGKIRPENSRGEWYIGHSYFTIVNQVIRCVFLDAGNDVVGMIENLFFLYIFFGGLECVGHSFAYVAHLWFLRDVWIRTQSTAVASWRATDLATHPSQISHPSLSLSHPSLSSLKITVTAFP